MKQLLEDPSILFMVVLSLLLMISFVINLNQLLFNKELAGKLKSEEETAKALIHSLRMAKDKGEQAAVEKFNAHQRLLIALKEQKELEDMLQKITKN